VTLTQNNGASQRSKFEEHIMRIIRNRVYRVSIIMIILTSFTPISIISKGAQAAIVGSHMIVSGDKKVSGRDINEEKVRRTLENKIVIEKLKSYGLSQEEVMVKMDRMSDDQIHQLASLSDRIPAGGNTGLVIGILAVVALVLLIIYLIQRV
jgi:hypothetical protein